MPRQLAMLILLGACVATAAGCPGTAPGTVDETKVSGTPKPSKGPSTSKTATPKPVASTYVTKTPTPGPQRTGTPTGSSTATPGPTGSGTPNPSATGTATPAAPTPTPEPAPKFATVNVEPTGFKPSTIRIQVNGSVTFINHDAGAEHSVAPDGDSQFTGTGTLDKAATAGADGGSAAIKFVEVGEYAYRCGVHPTEFGKVVVVPEQP